MILQFASAVNKPVGQIYLEQRTESVFYREVQEVLPG